MYNSFKNSYDIVTFQEDFSNEEGVFDTSSGVFTAPVAGFYMFSVQICGESQSPSSSQSFALLRSTKQEPIAFTLIYGNESLFCGPIVQFSELDAGESVFVETFGLRDKYSNIIDQFSGLLVKRYL